VLLEQLRKVKGTGGGWEKEEKRAREVTTKHTNEGGLKILRKEGGAKSELLGPCNKVSSQF